MTRIKHSLQLQLSLTITILLFIIALISGSLPAAAENVHREIEAKEQNAITKAKRAAHGGQVVSTDHDLTNWDVNILRGCRLFKIEVSHFTGEVSSIKEVNHCGNGEKLRELRAQAKTFARTAR